mgnify:CR=1 FL=1
MYDLSEIHESLVNGQRQQMVNQIDDYGYGFWEDYKEYLVAYHIEKQLEYFQDATISYFRIKAK